MSHYSDEDCVGLVETHFLDLNEAVPLESGKSFGPVRVAYEMYGAMNPDKSNVILVLHALSGTAHAAGYHTPADKHPGWWDMMIGPGKAFDTRRYCVICTNVLGGCAGTTGPPTVNPETGRPYGLSFPVISVKDMVTVQKMFMDQMGIPELLCVVGGSLGGMQVLEWAVDYPDYVHCAIAIASTARLSPQSIAFDEVGRRAIMADPRWNQGNFYESQEIPTDGLQIARMVGHITYLSEQGMQVKFGRRLKERDTYAFDFTPEFEVESYLRYQGESFSKRFDANSYLYITKAMDYFDIGNRTGGSLEKLFADVTASFLLIAFTSDWLFPPAQSKAIAKALRAGNKEVTYVEIETQAGHDAFLLEKERLSQIVSAYLEAVSRRCLA